MKKLVMLTAVAALSVSAVGLSQADELIEGTPASTSIADVAEAQEEKEAGTLLDEPKAAVVEDAPESEEVVPVVAQDSPVVLELIENYPNLVARIHPYATVCYEGEDCDVTPRSAGASADGGPRDGKAVYNQVCQTCHSAGLLGAPTYGDAGAWAPRIAKGKDTLYDHAINGFGNMPAKGGADIPDEEVQNAVDYMVENSQ